MTYSGGTWFPNNNSIHSGSRAVLAMDKGSRATFTFTGTGVSWVAYRDEWSGIARVRIDGSDVGTFDLYASPAMAQTVFYKKTGLSAGSHKISIEVLQKKNSRSGGYWVWIDAFDVTP